MSVRASAVRPLIVQPMWLSISMIFSMLAGSRSTDVTRFSAAKIVPSDVWIPTAVDPSCKMKLPSIFYQLSEK